MQNDRHRVAQAVISDDAGHRSEHRQEDGQGMGAYVPQRSPRTAPLGLRVGIAGLEYRGVHADVAGVPATSPLDVAQPVSLVRSESGCEEDQRTDAATVHRRDDPVCIPTGEGHGFVHQQMATTGPVSYTHLPLPTIL